MICTRVKVPGGTVTICSRGRRRRLCSICGTRPESKLCDGRPKSRNGKTCDAPLCSTCAVTRPDPKKSTDTLDYCASCARSMPPEQLAIGGTRGG